MYFQEDSKLEQLEVQGQKDKTIVCQKGDTSLLLIDKNV